MSEREQFEAWFDEWRRSTWRPLSSDPRKECPEHWNVSAKYHMSIAWQESRRSALKEAATLIGPKGKRPCDCDTCDCGNSGDMRAVAWWDEAKANADAIRALTGGA